MSNTVMFKVLDDTTRIAVRNLLKMVLDGTLTECSFDCMAVSHLIELLDSLGTTIDLSELNPPNGWKWDYYVEFNYLAYTFAISGSGYDGTMTLKSIE